MTPERTKEVINNATRAIDDFSRDVARLRQSLSDIRDIAKNGTRNTAAWQEIIEIADSAIGDT